MNKQQIGNMLTKNKRLIILFSLSLFSCNTEKDKEYISKVKIFDFLKKEKLLVEIEQIKLSINDSINVWKKQKIEGYNYAPFVFEKIDTLICLNKNRNKFIGAKIRKINITSTFDGITYFYGVKINNKWCFFDGPSMVIPRKNNNTPNSFEELSEVSYQNIFKYYLFKNERGELQINEHFFDDLTSNAWSVEDVRHWDNERWNKRYLEIVKENRAKIDTNDYSKMK